MSSKLPNSRQQFHKLAKMSRKPIWTKHLTAKGKPRTSQWSQTLMVIQGSLQTWGQKPQIPCKYSPRWHGTCQNPVKESWPSQTVLTISPQSSNMIFTPLVLFQARRKIVGSDQTESWHKKCESFRMLVNYWRSSNVCKYEVVFVRLQ